MPTYIAPGVYVEVQDNSAYAAPISITTDFAIQASAAMAAYSELNPVRAGLCADPKEGENLKKRLLLWYVSRKFFPPDSASSANHGDFAGLESTR
jgi:hypothetical protein